MLLRRLEIQINYRLHIIIHLTAGCNIKFTVFSPVITGAAGLNQNQLPTGPVVSVCSDPRYAKSKLDLDLVVREPSPKSCNAEPGNTLGLDVPKLRPVSIRTAAQGDVNFIQNDGFDFVVAKLRQTFENGEKEKFY